MLHILHVHIAEICRTEVGKLSCHSKGYPIKITLITQQNNNTRCL